MPKSYTGVYTASGKPVYNVEAYAATGAPTFSSSGKELFAPVAYAEKVDGAKRQSSSNPKYLYHYTDDHSLHSISSSGYIKSSSGPGDCSLGKGVYLTGKAPNCRSSNLLANNYGSSHVHKERAAKTNCYVRVDADKIGASNGTDRLGRNVWVTPGDLDLRNTNAKFGRR